MNKKIISLVLALVMVLGTFTSVFAETAKKEEAKKPAASEKVEKVVGKDNKIQYIIDKKLVEGYEDGSYGLDKNIKRSEITRLLVLANGNEDLAKRLQGIKLEYTDLAADHWADGVIAVGTTVPSDANGLPMLAGYPDKTFKPENNVTYAELAKMLVVLAKKDLTKDMHDHAVWAQDWMTWAAKLGILDDVNFGGDYNKAATRADAFTMVYNALYAMKEFKRVPANETRGILSELDNKTLQLNQDSKMEYKITDSTVFVIGVGRQQIQKVNVLNNKEYYLGSLVRILVNDKNEVTHIIELGNPEKMALNGKGSTAGLVLDNELWSGVADATASTKAYGLNTGVYKNDQISQYGFNSYVTFGFNADKTEAKRIHFENEGTANDITLRINDKTEVYVANPGNNQMKKVEDVAAALALLGYQNYQGDNAYRVYNVYAGFDTDSISRNWKEIKVDDRDRHTAKVIVFNLVNKNKDLEKFRVIESSSSKFATTLENTDGKLFERDNVRDTFNFPLNYGDKFDIIGLDNYRSSSNMVTYIDHSDTKAYPIVKITKVDSDKNYIEIEDVKGQTSFLDIRDADIFSAKRFGKLEEGNTIQFRVELDKNDKTTNVAEYVSLLGKDMKLEGSIVGLIPSADKAQRVGRIDEVKSVNGVWHMVVKVDHNLYDEADKYGYATYIVADQYVDALKAHVGEKVAFKVFERNNNGLFFATDIRFNVENGKKLPETLNALEQYKALVKGLPEAKDVDAKNYAKALEDAKKAKELFDKDMTAAQKAEVTTREQEKVTDVTTRAQAFLNNYNNFKKFVTAVKEAKNVKVEVAQAQNSDPAAIKAALVTEIEKLRTANDANSTVVTVTDVTIPADLTQPITANVVLKSQNARFTDTVNVTFTIVEK